MNNPAANRKTQTNSIKKARTISKRKFYLVAIGSATLILFSVVSMWVMGRELLEKSQKLNDVVVEMKSLQDQTQSLHKQTEELKQQSQVLNANSIENKKEISNLKNELIIQEKSNKTLQAENKVLKSENKDLVKKYRERREALEKKRLEATLVKKVAKIQSNNINEIKNTQPTGVFNASFYTPSCAGCTGKTASGVRATPGVTIAVDSRYWKLGTRFYVEGFGILIAQDTGGAIKGKNRVDICVSTTKEAYHLGKKNLKYWVLESN
ncbi:Cell wall-binding protein YocH precursor [compost metagenome]